MACYGNIGGGIGSTPSGPRRQDIQELRRNAEESIKKLKEKADAAAAKRVAEFKDTLAAIGKKNGLEEILKSQSIFTGSKSVENTSSSFISEEIKNVPENLPSNDTEFTDENGKLRPGVSPEVALESDGTLKDGWIIGEDGQPEITFLNLLKFNTKVKIEEIESRFPDLQAPKYQDPGFDQSPVDACNDGMMLDTNGSYQSVPKYKLQDGKLVQDGTVFKYVENKSRAI